jgi:GT2 family glycosyltransferase/thymidylate kinase
MVVALEGFPGTGKSSVIDLLRDIGFESVPEHVDFLDSIPPVPTTSEEKKKNHRRFLSVEKERAEAMSRPDLIDRSFVSSIVFNRLLGGKYLSEIREDYHELVKSETILVPDTAVILRRSVNEVMEALRGRDSMNDFWIDQGKVSTYYDLLEDELSYWNISYTIVENDGSLREVASDVASSIPAKITVFVLSFNALDYLKKTLRSIEEQIDVPYKLLVIDNNSETPTKKYLRKYEPQTGLCLSHDIIFNDHNRGFAPACNQALDRIDTEYYLLLNNDVELTSSSLDPVMSLLEDEAALVGPKTNSISESAPAFDQLLEGSAEEKTDVLLGHCIFGNTEKTANLDGFDEQYEVGNFEDIDLCLKMSEAGEDLYVCYDYCVHHHGHKSFKDSNFDLDTYFEKNRERFVEKWGRKGKELLQQYGF